MADLELAEFIEKLRGELETAIVQGDDSEVRFVADKIDLELKIAAERSADAKGGVSFKVFGVGAEAGGGGKASNAVTQTIRMSLSMVGRDGERRLISGKKTKDAL